MLEFKYVRLVMSLIYLIRDIQRDYNFKSISRALQIELHGGAYISYDLLRLQTLIR